LNKGLLGLLMVLGLAINAQAGLTAEPALVPDNKIVQSSPVAAITRTNPFLTAQEEQYYKEDYLGARLDYLLLSAILYFPGDSKAIINGQIVTVSDSIDNKEIVKILPDAVILQDSKGEYLVSLKKAGIK
jgi:hypothetical protein